MTTNDTAASNLPYRSNLGTPYFRGAYPTDDGVTFIDTSNPNLPKVKILEIDNNSATAVVTVVPTEISEKLDLSAFGFKQAVVFRWGDYDLLCCSNSLNGIVQSQNTITYVRNIYTGIWDVTDYAVSCLEKYYGTLIGGDSLSNNVYTLFSGFDDDGSLIDNQWTSKMYNIGVGGLKRTNRFVVRGLIQSTQNLDIYFSYDSGNFVKTCTVQGQASNLSPLNTVVSTISSFSESNKNTSFPLGSYFMVNKYAGQSFNNPTATTLFSCKFFLNTSGAPTGTVQAQLYAMSGVLGSTSVPTGAPLATSNPIDASTISSTFQLTSFNFTGNNNISLAANTNYVIVLNYSGDGSSSDYVYVGSDSTSPIAQGNASFSPDGSTWYSSTQDVCFYVYGATSANTANQATYVNTGQAVNVGSQTIGSGVIGGGGNPVTAYPFEAEFTIASDRYEYVQVQFQANNIGYIQIDNFAFKDNRYYGKRVIPSRTITY